MVIERAKIYQALTITNMYSDFGYDDTEKVNEKCKEVAPELFDNRLKHFQEQFLLALKTFCELFTVIQEHGLGIETA